MRFVMHPRWIAVVLAALWTLHGGAQPAWAQSASETALARELFIEGSRLSRDKKWLDARDRFERSLALKRAPITLYSLGVAQKETGLLVEALENFRSFLLERSDPATKPFEAPARNAIEELKVRVAEIRLAIEPAGVEGLRVAIDSEEVPIAALDSVRLVNPGPHHLLAEAPGYQAANSRVTLEEGAAATIQLRLVPDEAARPGATPPPPPSYALSPPPQPPHNTRDDKRWLSYALIGGGAASLTAGATLGLIGIAQTTYASDPMGLEQEAARDKAMVADLFAAVGIVGISVGVVLLISSKPSGRARLSKDGVTLHF